MVRMRQKELRLALVSTGGISLAVYMHGVTKELWHLCARVAPPCPLPQCRARHGRTIGHRRRLARPVRNHRAGPGLSLRVMIDILSGASAGGINAVFLAQALATGQSLEPLTRLWLERADSDILLDPDARPWGRFAKFWAQPLVWAVLRWPAPARRA
jgi:predicted acylesterase/phospholipase RssA